MSTIILHLLPVWERTRQKKSKHRAELVLGKNLSIVQLESWPLPRYLKDVEHTPPSSTGTKQRCLIQSWGSSSFPPLMTEHVRTGRRHSDHAKIQGNALNVMRPSGSMDLPINIQLSRLQLSLTSVCVSAFNFMQWWFWTISHEGCFTSNLPSHWLQGI